MSRKPLTSVLAAVLLAVVSTGAPLAQERVELSLERVLRLALENNLDLVAARVNPALAEQQVLIQEAFFDPTVASSLSYSETSQTPIDPTQPADRTNADFSVSVNQPFKFGADGSLVLFTGRNDAPAFNRVNPFYQSGLQISYNMPLLRDLGWEYNQERLLLARADLEISREELSRDAQATLETVEGAYWNVLAARRALEVERQALERTEDLLELNRRKVEVGTLAPIEITQAEAGVSSQVEQVIVAEVALENTEDELLRLLAIPGNDPMWDRPLVLTDRPVFVPLEVDVAAAIEEAMQERPELVAARQRVRNNELSQRVARRGLKHDLDLSVQYTALGDNDESLLLPGPDGQFGTIDDIFTPVTGTIGDSFDEIPENENFSWRAALNYTIPIGNRSAKASHRIAELNTRQAEIDLTDLEQTIRVEVRQAAREVESGIKRVEAQQKNVELQKEKLDAEQKKFENGMSTSFEVLTFQNDLADAELALIRAQLDYIQALTALQRVKGTLLEARGLGLAMQDPGGSSLPGDMEAR